MICKAFICVFICKCGGFGSYVKLCARRILAMGGDTFTGSYLNIYCISAIYAMLYIFNMMAYTYRPDSTRPQCPVVLVLSRVLSIQPDRIAAPMAASKDRNHGEIIGGSRVLRVYGKR